MPRATREASRGMSDTDIKTLAMLMQTRGRYMDIGLLAPPLVNTDFRRYLAWAARFRSEFRPVMLDRRCQAFTLSQNEQQDRVDFELRYRRSYAGVLVESWRVRTDLD